MICLEGLFWYLNHTPHDDLFHMVIHHMLKNIHEVSNMNIYEMAEACYTSPATISRLVKKLNFKSFAFFQKSLVDSLQQYEHYNRHLPLDEMHSETDHVMQLLDTVEDMIKDFKAKYHDDDFTEVARILHESNHVILYSLGISPESSLQSDLVMSGIPCDIMDEMANLDVISELDEHSVVIFSQAKRMDTINTEKAVAFAKSKGAKIIVITDSKYFSILKEAEKPFVFNGKLHLVDMYIFQFFIMAIDIKYRAIYMDKQ